MDDKDNYSIIKKIILLFRQNEFKAMLFVLGLFIFCLPYLIDINAKPPYAPFFYYFITWAGLILCLIIMDSDDGDD